MSLFGLHRGRPLCAENFKLAKCLQWRAKPATRESEKVSTIPQHVKPMTCLLISEATVEHPLQYRWPLRVREHQYAETVLRPRRVALALLHLWPDKVWLPLFSTCRVSMCGCQPKKTNCLVSLSDLDKRHGLPPAIPSPTRRVFDRHTFLVSLRFRLRHSHFLTSLHSLVVGSK
jgi:hypothetical protein